MKKADEMTEAQGGAGAAAPDRGRMRTLGPVLVFDIAGPIAAYYLLRAAGLSTVGALILSGVVPAFGIVCLASLRSSRPMIFRFALESMGRDTPKGREFADRWRYPGFRHSFRVTTVVWGLMFIAEAATQAVIVETASANVAKATSNLLILPFAAVVIAWNIAYARRGQRQGALADEARRARGEAPPVMPTG